MSNVLLMVIYFVGIVTLTIAFLNNTPADRPMAVLCVAIFLNISIVRDEIKKLQK